MKYVAAGVRRLTVVPIAVLSLLVLPLNFINAAKVGETLRASGHVIHAGRRTVVAGCSVAGQNGRLVATASATFAVTREKE